MKVFTYIFFCKMILKLTKYNICKKKDDLNKKDNIIYFVS